MDLPPPPPAASALPLNVVTPQWKLDVNATKSLPLTPADSKWRTTILMIFAILTVIFAVMVFAISVFAGPPVPIDAAHPGSVMATIAGWLAAIVSGATILFSVLTFKKPWMDSTVKGVMLGFWAILPPIWFLVEFLYLVAPADLDRFKFRVELAMHIWTAVVAVMAILFYKSVKD